MMQRTEERSSPAALRGSAPSDATLPALLLEQARLSGKRPAVHYKQRGAWHSLSWAEVENEVARLAEGLAQHGYAHGHRLVVLGAPSLRQLLLVLSALSLGGVVVATEEVAVLQPELSSASFVFCGSSEHLAHFRGGAGSPQRAAVVDDRRTTARLAAAGEVGYSALLAAGAPHGDVRSSFERVNALAGTHLAFESYSSDAPVDWTHNELVREASRLNAELDLSRDQRCLLGQSLATNGTPVLALASWLLGGFSLLLPEEVGSLEADGKELGATYRFAAPQAWDAWVATARARLAPEGTLRRRFVEWALAVTPEPRSAPARWLARLFAVWPLRRVLGVERLTRALSVDGAPSPSTQRFLSGLGLPLSVALILTGASEVSTGTALAESSRPRARRSA